MDTPKRIALGLLAVGLLALVAGMGWGVLFVGVPYPDPTPAQRAEEAFHLEVSGTAMLLGVGALAGSLALFLLRLIWRQRPPA